MYGDRALACLEQHRQRSHRRGLHSGHPGVASSGDAAHRSSSRHQPGRHRAERSSATACSPAASAPYGPQERQRATVVPVSGGNTDRQGDAAAGLQGGTPSAPRRAIFCISSGRRRGSGIPTCAICRAAGRRFPAPGRGPRRCASAHPEAGTRSASGLRHLRPLRDPSAGCGRRCSPPDGLVFGTTSIRSGTLARCCPTVGELLTTLSSGPIPIQTPSGGKSTRGRSAGSDDDLPMTIVVAPAGHARCSRQITRYEGSGFRTARDGTSAAHSTSVTGPPRQTCPIRCGRGMVKGQQ